MRQDKKQDKKQDQNQGGKTGNPAVSGSVLVCIVLTSGALFGMAAQTALSHFGLDLGSVRDDLIVDRVAQSRSALAWWSWWLVGVAAFFVGRFSVMLTRFLVANWCLFRGLRLVLSAGVVLGLSLIGSLPPAPSALGTMTRALLSLVVVVLSASLALLGARSAAAAELKRAARAPGADTARRRKPGRVAALPPMQGGGSVDPGLPMSLFRRRHARVSARVPVGRRVARWALVCVLVLVVFATAAAVGGATVLLDMAAPGAVREFVAWNLAPADASPIRKRMSAIVLALLPPSEAPRPVPRILLARLEPAATDAVPLVVVARQRPITAASWEIVGAPTAERELTFANGYAKRRAALDAAGLIGPLPIAEIKMPVQIKKLRLALRASQYSRGRRADFPPRGDVRYALNQHYVPDQHYGSSRHSGGHSRHAASGRHPTHAHRRGRDHYGHDRYARNDRYGYARF
jgi:hypothetical protein